MVFVLLQSSFRTSLKSSCPKRHVGFPHGVTAKPQTGVSYTCSESFSWLCQFLSTKLLMPLVPSNLSYQTSLWGWMWNGSRNWVNNDGWGALLDSGVVINWDLSTCLVHPTGNAGWNSSFGKLYSLNHVVNSGQRLILIERDLCWKP